jgi:hypothetical protein
MYVCMYVCMYVYMYVCTCMYIYVFPLSYKTVDSCIDGEIVLDNEELNSVWTMLSTHATYII